MENNRKPQLKIIQGDLPLSPKLAGGDFVRAEVTDTRLMGVVGLHVVRQNEIGEYHQLFYLDFEEYGFDDYQSFQLSEDPTDTSWDNSSDLERAISDMFGGLGAKWSAISERESIYLIHDALRLNQEYDSELPDEQLEFSPILDNPITLTKKEISELWTKITDAPKTDYQVINYFIMRCAALDEHGLKFLSSPDAEFELFKLTEPGALFRNEIKPKGDSAGVTFVHDYTTTSLVSDDDGFKLIISDVSVAGPWITDFHTRESMRISPWEASLIMAQNEYISLLRLGDEPAAITLSVAIKTFYTNSELHTHPSGNLFMVFRKDNEHTANQVYRLDADVLASIYVRFNGEVVIASSDGELVQRYESVIRELSKAYGFSVRNIGRYLFPDMTLGHYVKDEYGEFDSFLEFLQFLGHKDEQ